MIDATPGLRRHLRRARGHIDRHYHVTCRRISTSSGEYTREDLA